MWQLTYFLYWLILQNKDHKGLRVPKWPTPQSQWNFTRRRTCWCLLILELVVLTYTMTKESLCVKFSIHGIKTVILYSNHYFINRTFRLRTFDSSGSPRRRHRKESRVDSSKVPLWISPDSCEWFRLRHRNDSRPHTIRPCLFCQPNDPGRPYLSVEKDNDRSFFLSRDCGVLLLTKRWTESYPFGYKLSTYNSQEGRSGNSGPTMTS